jgi:hypothetical protein
LPVGQQRSDVERLRHGIGGELLNVALPADADAATRALVERLVEVTEQLARRCTQLQEALDSRVLIEQAKGVLAERLGVSPDEAFVILRRGARHHRIRIHELAAKVVSSESTPPELAWFVDKGPSQTRWSSASDGRAQ